MNKRNTWRWLGIGVLALLGLAAAAIIWWDKLPYQSLATRQIRGILQQYGLEVTSLEVDKLTSSSAELSDIVLGKQLPLAVDRIQAEYDWQEARSGKLRRIEITSPEVQLYEKSGTWQIGGLEPLNGGASPSAPLNIDRMQAILPGEIKLVDGHLRAAAKDWRAESDIEGKYAATPEMAANLHLGKLQLIAPGLKLTSPEAQISSTYQNKRATPVKAMLTLPKLALEAQKYVLNTGIVTLEAGSNANLAAWKGQIKIGGITIKGLPAELPPLQLSGPFTYNGTVLTADLRLKDNPASYDARLAIHVPLSDAKKGVLLVKSMQFPWGGGMIRSQNVRLPLNADTPISLALAFDGVDIAPLLKEVSQGKIKGTGKLTGVLPITYAPNGTLTLQDGTAQALEAGVLNISAEALPGGSNAQLDMVRKALEDFHYTSLKVQLSSNAKQESVIRLSLEGSNPDAFEGRPVKLNVNVTGDVLPLIQQSLLPIQDFKQFLKSQEKR